MATFLSIPCPVCKEPIKLCQEGSMHVQLTHPEVAQVVKKKTSDEIISRTVISPATSTTLLLTDIAICDDEETLLSFLHRHICMMCTKLHNTNPAVAPANMKQSPFLS